MRIGEKKNSYGASVVEPDLSTEDGRPAMYVNLIIVITNGSKLTICGDLCESLGYTDSSRQTCITCITVALVMNCREVGKIVQVMIFGDSVELPKRLDLGFYNFFGTLQCRKVIHKCCTSMLK